MPYCFCLLFFLCINMHGSGQELLANGNFEEENICTEYKQNCAPEAWIGNAFLVNYYFDTEGWAADGSHFVGVIAGNQDLKSRRSFVRSRLLCGLRKGQHYRLQFAVRSRHAVFDSIGIYFSATDFLFETRPYGLLQPSLLFRDTAFASQQNQPWKKISFDYTATGEEVFITIGSFKKQEYAFNLPPEYKGNYYLYLDAVSMVPEDRHELVCKDVDSLRTLNYQENERHSMLEKKVALNRKNVPTELPREPTILQRIDTLIIPDILFATASARLNEGSFRVLDSFCLAIAVRKIDSVVIGGHTDSVGTLVYNNRLSEERAGSVSSYIKSKLSFDDDLFRTYYFAYLRPLAPNITPAGRQRNRRVEIYLYTHE